MEFLTTPISGLFVIRPKRHTDSRGYFMETYREDLLGSVAGDIKFVQDNESESSRGVLRGLHLQTGNKAQAKLVRVVEGSVFDVVVDLRENSDTFGQWYGIELSHENGLMMFIPRGFAHGFLVLSDKARFSYKVDNYYAPEAELTIKFDDRQIGIEWPKCEGDYVLSQRDRENSISFETYEEKYLNNR